MIRHILTVLAVALFVPSQVFWIWQVRKIGRRLIPRPSLHRPIGWAAASLYLLLLVYNFLWPKPMPEAAHLTLRAALLVAPYQWWMLASLTGFLLINACYALGLLLRSATWLYGRIAAPASPESGAPLSPERRRFLARAGVAVSATPFAACAYGLLYERTEIEVTRQPIVLSRLPKAFQGFRIAQLSDIHIGQFMSDRQIRSYVAMVNALKPDLVVLTGDFVTWVGSPAATVVGALAGLRGPYGVLGSIGNHELWAGVADSITQQFAEQEIKILRSERSVIEQGGERLNIIGVDYQTLAHFGPKHAGVVREFLPGVASLMLPDTANILLSHNPNTFDRAAELGVDLSVAGHTHGGQVTLEYVSPDLSPARLITPYVRGWFRKGASQLYVNRGVGTIFSPVRFGSPPEITIYELNRS